MAPLLASTNFSLSISVSLQGQRKPVHCSLRKLSESVISGGYCEVTISLRMGCELVRPVQQLQPLRTFRAAAATARQLCALICACAFAV